MARFVTQTVEDKPRVLLIGESSWLSSKLHHFLHRKECLVEVVTLDQVLSQPEIIYEDWFRIIWLEGWEEVSQEVNFTHRQSHQLFEFEELLKDSPTPVLFVPRLASVFKDEKNELATFRDYFIWQKNLQEFVSRASSMMVLAGQDVTAHKSSWWFPFSFFVHELDSGILLDPQVFFYVLSSEEFTTILKEAIFRPIDAKKILLRGQKQHSTTILKELQRSYRLIFGEELMIQARARKVADFETNSFQVPKLETEALPDLLQASIHALPSFARASEYLDARRDRRPVEEKPEIKQPKLTPAPEPSPEPEPQPRPEIQPVVPLAEKQPSPSLQEDIERASNKYLDEKINTTLSKFRAEEKVEKITKNVKKKSVLKTKNKKRKAVFFAGLMVVGASMAVVLLALIFVFSQFWLKRSLQNMTQSGDILTESTSLQKVTSVVETQIAVYSNILPSSFFTDATILVSAASEIQDVVVSLEELEVQQRQQVVGLFASDKAQFENNDQLLVKAQTLYEKLSRAKSRLEELLDETAEPQQRQQVEEAIELLNTKRGNLAVYQQIHPLLESVLGQDEKRTYAFMLQNNQELRATGGFIQAVAVATIQDGIVIDSQVFSVYTLDQGLTGVVSPPADLQQILGETQLFLRDSNWDPNFPTTASQASWFIEQKLNKPIDGVIGLNLISLEKILKEIGPVELPQYNEVLTDRNLMERMEFHSEVTLVETDQSSDYSQEVLAAIINKLGSLSEEKAQGLLRAVSQSLKSKDIQIYLSRQGEGSTMALLGWSGSLVEPECPAQFNTDTCLVDSLAVIDSNVGINKANYHLDRQDSHQVSIEQGRINHQHTITFTNESTTNAWPKGAYKGYTRFFMPATAQVTAVSINDQAVPAEQILELPNQHGKSVLGVLSNTPIQSSTRLKIEYSVPYQAGEEFSYSFFIQKQPGLEQPLDSLSLSHSPELRPTLIAPQAAISGNSVTFENFENDHVFVGVSF